MPIDEVKFGELIGTVGSLVTAVADFKAAIIPALKEQRVEMAKYRDECRVSMDDHRREDAKNHETLETLCKPIADLQDVINGDGTPEDLGLKKTVNNLVVSRIRDKAWAAGVAASVSSAIFFVGWAIEVLHK